MWYHYPKMCRIYLSGLLQQRVLTVHRGGKTLLPKPAEALCACEFIRRKPKSHVAQVSRQDSAAVRWLELLALKFMSHDYGSTGAQEY
jgi:hypothetical protein